MISSVNQSSYLQNNEIMKNNGVNKSDNNIGIEDSKVSEIKKAIEDGTYKMLPTNLLAQLFSESEFGI